eukprot:jgi/Antlo1/44/1002
MICDTVFKYSCPFRRQNTRCFFLDAMLFFETDFSSILLKYFASRASCEMYRKRWVLVSKILNDVFCPIIFMSNSMYALCIHRVSLKHHY